MMILRARNLTHSFEHLLYENLNFELEASQSMAILGVSGSGKSSILNHLSTMLPPNKGKIDLCGKEDVYALSKQELLKIRRYDLGIIFQSHYLLRGFSAQENLKIATLLAETLIDEEVLQALQIKDVLSQNIGSLSGGQQQRVSIARVLCKRPKIIFADEPTGNLDSQTAKSVMDKIFEYIKKNHSALILATHDEELARRCDFVYRLKDKKLVQEN
ncbi:MULTISPECIES: ABC transporter ATP-binding protein [unclassified Helicobacter]|uniref:ABC transporter ATP-binding protein n=1 Tax=unclassified Helicobacter TaxID=2593540 RepID=UPI0018F85630|nr:MULTISPECIES: ATP-binding cassette domain-containing protein [unclassified Helicobacter]